MLCSMSQLQLFLHFVIIVIPFLASSFFFVLYNR